MLKDALKPNLVQTLEHTPAIVHGGPFANIAHGCNSVMATRTALKLADYTVTEAGFGADLGAEKFVDIKCRKAGIWPDACVIVATVRALKMHGGLDKKQLAAEDLDALEKGIPNLLRHVSNIKNVYWAKGGEGGVELANEVVRLCDLEEKKYGFVYDTNMSIKEEIEAVATRVYRADGVNYSANAEKEIAKLEQIGFHDAPVCIAKTQYSFTDDPTVIGAPRGFRINVVDVKADAGAGFLVVKTGNIMTMPGLPKVPAAENIDIDSSGRISGLF